MGRNIFWAAIFIFFASKGFGIMKTDDVPSGLFLYGSFGLAYYEHLATTKNHPFIDSAFLRKGAGKGKIELEYSYSIVNVKAFLDWQDAGSNSTYYDEVDRIYKEDTAWNIRCTYRSLTLGIYTLPVKWHIKFIPEIGYYDYKESLITTIPYWGKSKTIYSEEVKGTGISYGGALMYNSGDIPSLGSVKKGKATYSLKLGYFYNDLPEFKVNNYFLQGRVYASDFDNNALLFVDLEIGMSGKTDGRKSCYGSMGMGFNLFKINKFLRIAKGCS